MSQLSPETIKRIEAEANKLSESPWYRCGYIAGATAEATRYKACVDTLKEIVRKLDLIRSDHVCNDICTLAETALNTLKVNG